MNWRKMTTAKEKAHIAIHRTRWTTCTFLGVSTMLSLWSIERSDRFDTGDGKALLISQILAKVSVCQLELLKDTQINDKQKVITQYLKHHTSFFLFQLGN